VRVVVKFHESARADYDAWQARLAASPTGNPAVARVHAEELVRHLVQTNGLPPGATFHPELDPPCWVWRYSADTWVRFVHKGRRTGAWGGVVLEVVVTGVSSLPPG
jgi:hypothetical protein